jgi:ferrochelatase
MEPKKKIAVLLMAYGAVKNLEDIPNYLKDIRSGRPVSAELIRDVKERYSRIGGSSPLVSITQAQAKALEKQLNGAQKQDRGITFQVYMGMRHSEPSIFSAVRNMMDDGHDCVVALPMTPYYSRLSVGVYLDKLERAVVETQASLRILPVGTWCEQPLLVQAFVHKLRLALEQVPTHLRNKTAVLFCAHSLPEKMLEEDPYVRQLASTAKAVARQAGLRCVWELAYQSQGSLDMGPWLKPEIGDRIAQLAKQILAVVLAPIGFVSDHLETLYDLDIVCRDKALKLGLYFARVETLNTDPLFIQVLANVVVKAVERQNTVV